MIIKRVKLENYRSHSNTTVDFSKGVNLILGKNGKGKTSILEAISSVMFNTKDRSGKETGKNFIKFNEKSGKIVILKIRYADFSTMTKRKSLSQKIQDAETISQMAIQLYESLTDKDKDVRLLGVTVTGF